MFDSLCEMDFIGSIEEQRPFRADVIHTIFIANIKFILCSCQSQFCWAIKVEPFQINRQDRFYFFNWWQYITVLLFLILLIRISMQDSSCSNQKAISAQPLRISLQSPLKSNKKRIRTFQSSLATKFHHSAPEVGWNQYMASVRQTYNLYLSFSWILCLILAYKDNSICSRQVVSGFTINFQTWLKIQGFTTLLAFINHIIVLLITLDYPQCGRLLAMAGIMFLPFKFIWNIVGMILFLATNINNCSHFLQVFASIYFVTFASYIFLTLIKYLNKTHREKKEEMKENQKEILEALAQFTEGLLQEKEDRKEERQELINTLAGLLFKTQQKTDEDELKRTIRQRFERGSTIYEEEETLHDLLFEEDEFLNLIDHNDYQ